MNKVKVYKFYDFDEDFERIWGETQLCEFAQAEFRI